jgi:hypothetical protein
VFVTRNAIVIHEYLPARLGARNDKPREKTFWPDAARMLTYKFYERSKYPKRLLQHKHLRPLLAEDQLKPERDLERRIRHRDLLAVGHELRKLLLQIGACLFFEARRELIVQRSCLGPNRRFLELAVT